MIYYHVSYTNPLTSYLDIRMELKNLDSPEIFLQLPAWRPGRYELQHFAQKIQKFEVTDGNGNQLPYKKVTKDRWQVPTRGAESLTVNYRFYARQMDAGGSWLDETQLYINGVNCFMYAEGFETDTCELTLAIPENWQIACGMAQPVKHTLQARDFEQLVDSPLIASPTLKHEVYTVDAIPFHIWIQGDCQPDFVRIIKEFTAFTTEQLQLFGDFPVSEYHYLFQILPYKHYHGVEHGNSTVITLGPSEILMAPLLYKELLGVSSHELFHTWNIKKIRPVEMLPYDYTKENYFRTGFVAEGLTTYYGDYMLARSGVFSAQQYFNELDGVLAKHFVDEGWKNLSVADSSFDLWLDGYKPGIPDRKVSIYHKGALAALLLDLELRKSTNNEKCLDDVMRMLWNDFGKRDIGYSEQDYEAIVEVVGGRSFRKYFDDFIYGTVPLEKPLDDALQYVGCRLKTENSVAVSESVFGFKTVVEGIITKVSATAPGSPAYSVLMVDDELVAVNGRKVELNLLTLLHHHTSVELTIFRNKALQTVSLKADDNSYYQKHSVVKAEQATDEQKANFELWLKQGF